MNPKNTLTARNSHNRNNNPNSKHISSQNKDVEMIDISEDDQGSSTYPKVKFENQLVSQQQMVQQQQMMEQQRRMNVQNQKDIQASNKKALTAEEYSMQVINTFLTRRNITPIGNNINETRNEELMRRQTQFMKNIGKQFYELNREELKKFNGIKDEIGKETKGNRTYINELQKAEVPRIEKFVNELIHFRTKYAFGGNDFEDLMNSMNIQRNTEKE